MQLLLLKFNKETVENDNAEAGTMDIPVCTNYRLANRRMKAAMPETKKKLKDDDAGRVSPDGDRKLKNKKKSNAPKKQAEEPEEDDEDKAAKAEAARKAKEEAERRAAEDEARANQKPKTYDQDEIEAYEKFSEEIETFFGELAMKQLTRDEAPGAAEGNPDAVEGEAVEEAAAAEEAVKAEASAAEGSVAAPEETEPVEKVIYGARNLV